jgi:pimeloyl-ACP methyl ester carboxylesterase
VVLVHGAWHGAWCWQPVVDGLRAQDVVVDAIDLPGHGDDTQPLTDLHGDAARVTAALDALATVETGPVVLVGHSYGGAVITQAGLHASIAHLVYVAAFMLDEGESLLASAADDPRAAAIDHTGRPDAAAALDFADDGTSTVTLDGAKDLFYNDCPPEVAARATARLTPQPMTNLGQSPTTVAWRDLPSTYAVCTLDNAVHPDLQRILADRATHQVEWASDHSPFLSQPAVVVELLANLARSIE